MRYPSLLLAVLIPVPAAVGQTSPPEPPGKPGRVELTVAATPAPVPALRVELVPPSRDRLPGNAAVGYLKAAALQPAGPKEPEAVRKQSEQLGQWEQLPPDQLPAKDVAEFLAGYRDMLRSADEGARFDRCDWQQRPTASPEDVGLALATLSGGREVNRYLSLRAKLELARNRPDDAVRTLQTGFQHSKHVGEGGSLIHLLVGESLSFGMVARVEDLVRHPGGPNLYWALTALPRPFIDPRPGLDGESRVNASFLPGLKDLEAGPVSEEKAKQALRDAIRLLAATTKDDRSDGGLADLIQKFGMVTSLTGQGPGAKKDLLARGWPARDVAAMPDAQAILLRAAAVHRELWDDQVKLFYLPYPAAADEMARARKRAEAVKKANPEDPLIAVFSLIYPAVEKVHATHARLDRRLAQLRAVEAVRLYAAQHDGALPAALAEVTAVPVPDDPQTGKPFVYAVRGETFTLSAPPPKGETANPANALEYVVTVRKGEKK